MCCEMIKSIIIIIGLHVNCFSLLESGLAVSCLASTWRTPTVLLLIVMKLTVDGLNKTTKH